MSDFSKYLDNLEELVNTYKTNKKSSGLYLNLFLMLLAFFILYPIFKAGPRGFWLWLVAVLFITNNIIKALLAQRNLYLLTDRRLIYLEAVNTSDFKIKRYIHLSHIEVMKKHHIYSIELMISGKKYYINNIKQRDLLYDSLEIYLKNQNLV